MPNFSINDVEIRTVGVMKTFFTPISLAADLDNLTCKCVTFHVVGSISRPDTSPI